MKNNFNIKDIIRPSIKALKPYSSARDEFHGVPANMVFLDANENPFENGVNRYPDPHQNKLKAVLSEIKGVPSQNILLGNGSDEVLDLIFRAFCEPNQDNIITLPPTYGMYEVLANLNAVAVKKVNLDSDFHPNVEAILSIADAQSKLLFICSPNNPSGNSFTSEAVKTLIENFKGIVVIDEAYIDFSSEESWLSKLSQYSNLIVTQTLSKAYGMAGIRLGICYASEAIVSVLNSIKPPYNINELTQQKAVELLSNKALVSHQIAEILQQRNWLVSALKQINFISKIYPTDANFVLVKVDDANRRYTQLIENGVVIRNRTTQPNCENTLRLTVGTTNENEKLIKVLLSISKP
ncbi:MAG: histidinol-phosphate transaminase [Flavobacteriaceae bacterium]